MALVTEVGHIVLDGDPAPLHGKGPITPKYGSGFTGAVRAAYVLKPRPMSQQLLSSCCIAHGRVLLCLTMGRPFPILN